MMFLSMIWTPHPSDGHSRSDGGVCYSSGGDSAEGARQRKMKEMMAEISVPEG